jgi:hypothetical protein
MGARRRRLDGRDEPWVSLSSRLAAGDRIGSTLQACLVRRRHPGGKACRDCGISSGPRFVVRVARGNSRTFQFCIPIAGFAADGSVFIQMNGRAHRLTGYLALSRRLDGIRSGARTGRDVLQLSRNGARPFHGTGIAGLIAKSMAATCGWRRRTATARETTEI